MKIRSGRACVVSPLFWTIPAPLTPRALLQRSLADAHGQPAAPQNPHLRTRLVRTVVHEQAEPSRPTALEPRPQPAQRRRLPRLGAAPPLTLLSPGPRQPPARRPLEVVVVTLVVLLSRRIAARHFRLALLVLRLERVSVCVNQRTVSAAAGASAGGAGHALSALANRIANVVSCVSPSEKSCAV